MAALSKLIINMQTLLSQKEKETLIEETANWLVKYDLATIAVFILEINRPIAPITGNLTIALAPIIRPLLKDLPCHQLGILLQEDEHIKWLIKKIEEKSNDK